MAHDLPAQEHFGEYVSHHIVGWAVYHVDCPARNDLLNKVEVYVDVLRVRVIVVIHCKLSAAWLSQNSVIWACNEGNNSPVR